MWRTLDSAWRVVEVISILPNEIASLTPMFAGVNYRRLEGYKSLRWPVTVRGADEPLLYTMPGAGLVNIRTK
jgi:formate dehydrogenase major subunit